MDKSLFEKAFYEVSFEGGYCCNRLELFDVTTSTNDEICKIAENGGPEGSLCISASQTMGQGRSGRSFFSPAGGNLYMSFLLRPASDVPFGLLTPAAAVAVTRTIEKVCKRQAGIKWVNDIFYNDRKVCGIIAKAFNMGQSNMYIVIGIGINVHMSSEEIPEDIKAYGTLYDTKDTGDEMIIPRLAAGIYSEYMNIYTNLDDLDFMDEYRKKSIIIGSKVRYITGNEEKYVKVTDINDAGQLVAQDDTGNIFTYNDGEIRIQIE